MLLNLFGAFNPFYNPYFNGLAGPCFSAPAGRGFSGLAGRGFTSLLGFALVPYWPEFSYKLRITLAGFPTATAPAGMSLTTTDPAPHYGVVTNGDPGADDYPATKPNIVTDSDGFAAF